MIFIDSVSIPNSDIFLYFPYLFKAKRRKNLPGYEDFVQKIIEMGLSDFIFKRKPNFYVSKEQEEENKKKNFGVGKPNWWFLDYVM